MDVSRLNLALDHALIAGGGLIVDLREVEFIDTAILACLAKYAKSLSDTECRMKVKVRHESHPDCVLKTVGFSHIMDIAVSAPVRECKVEETTA